MSEIWLIDDDDPWDSGPRPLYPKRVEPPEGMVVCFVPKEDALKVGIPLFDLEADNE